MAPPKFGIRILNYGRYANRDSLINQARITEDEGYYSIWGSERLVVPDPPNQPWSRVDPSAYEVLSLLSYVAALTDRVKLGTFVLIAPLRNPIVLARQVATLDVLSRGRVILGLGLGWMKEEFKASRVPPSQRAPRTDELIGFLREVWRTDAKVVRFNGRFINLGPTIFEPKPNQDRVPIWIGGESVPALRRAGTLGDGWMSDTWRQPARIRRGVERIRSEAVAKGRSADDVTISCKFIAGDFARRRASVIHRVEELWEAGVSHIIVDFQRESAYDYARRIRSFSREVMASF